MNNRQSEDGRMTLAELLTIIIVTIQEYEGTTGIFRNRNKEQE